MDERRMEYVGFWSRVGATLLDWLILLLLSLPVLIFFGDFFPFAENPFTRNQWLLRGLPLAIYVIFFWKSSWQGTPGKRIIRARVVDAKTGAPVTLLQGIVRYLSYLISIIPLFLGILWVAWDSKNKAGMISSRERLSSGKKESGDCGFS
jgi:uncharacterized RDD family membrane protein YckC